MAESRKLYLWQGSRCSNITAKFEVQLFCTRREAEKRFSLWRKDPDTRDMVYLVKVWSAWNRPEVCSMMNGRTKCDLIMERPVFKYAKEAWEEHERLMNFGR